jgi:hypothetical protein
MIELAVAYRIYPGAKSPAFFPNDKFRLSELCLRSFKRSLGNLRVKVWAILDGCPPKYEELFRDILAEENLEIIQQEKIGNQRTFSLQVDLLTRQTEANYVYFAEDDYFYFPEALENMVNFMRANVDVDFVTPYDHPDSYYTSSRRERHLVRPFGDRYWRTASSTCLTFLTSRKNLLRTESLFRSYAAGNMDCPIWLALTQKFGLVNPRIHWSNLLRLKIWARTWLWGFREILFSRPYRLWAPMPTLATHMESGCLSPLVDWQNAVSCAEELRLAIKPTVS